MMKHAISVMGWILIILCMFSVIEFTEALGLNITVEVKSLNYTMHIK